MFCFALLALLCCGVFVSSENIQPGTSSYSGEYGGGGGRRFSHSGNQMDGCITGMRIRCDSWFIVGLQFRYGKEWSDYVGGRLGDLEEIILYPEESIVQVYGKYMHYLHQLVFITNKGRYFPFGRDTGISFNAAPLFQGTVLRFISGSSGALIDSIGFHWDNCSAVESERTE